MIQGTISARRVEEIALLVAHDVVDEISDLMVKVGGEPIVEDARKVIVEIVFRQMHCGLLDIIEDVAASGD